MTAESLVVDPEQILRFSGPGPRYTSYPTAPAWLDRVGETEARAALARARARKAAPFSAYVHVPFCRSLCLFCGCTVEITQRADRVTSYLEALRREFEMVAASLGERRRIAQLHWGGGTPTHLSSSELEALFRAFSAHFELLPEAELSVEIHPHVTTPEQVDTLLELGFRRISMGVQDTDPHVQAIVRRHQTLEETVRLVERVRQHGGTSINLDLMYGLPAQTRATFERTLETVISIRPERMAVYGYAHVPWLKPAQRPLENERLPDPLLRAELFALAVERLGRAGYEAIGLDHFALPDDALCKALKQGTLQRNFMGYGVRLADEMLAFGMSAIADVGGAFLQNARETKAYEEAVRAGRLATVRGCVRSGEDDLRRAVIQALMCRLRLDLGELEHEFGVEGLDRRFAREWETLRAFEAEGFCRVDERSVEVLPKGRLFLRHLAMAFDAYLERSPERPRFSQTV